MLYASLRLASMKIPKQTPCQLLLWCWVKYHDQKQLKEKGLTVLDGCPYWLEGRGSRSGKLADYISIPAQEAVGAEWIGVALPPRPGSSSSKAASPNSQTVPPRYHPVLDGKKAKKHSKVLSISVGAQLFPTQGLLSACKSNIPSMVFAFLFLLSASQDAWWSSQLLFRHIFIENPYYKRITLTPHSVYILLNTVWPSEAVQSS